MTEKLFYHDPTLLEFDASITDYAENGALLEVALDRTAFFPGGGGQPSDRGTLGGARVVDMKERDDDIVHVVESQKGLGPGVRVHGSVDGLRRRDFMIQHTGQHVLSQALLATGGLPTVSVHFGDETTTVELDAPSVPEAVLHEAEERANSIVRENRPIRVHEVDSSEVSRFPLRRTPPEVGRLRIVEVGSFDWAACSGLHVGATGEIILIKIVGQERIRGRTRIHALIGPRAMDDYGRKITLARNLTRLLTCGESDIASRVEELLRTIRENERELKRLRAERAVLDADSTAQSRLVSRVFDGAGVDYLKAFAERVVASPGRAVVVVDRSADGFQWIIAHSLGDAVTLPQLVTPFFSKAGARGGGRGAWMQGGGHPAAAAAGFAEAVAQAVSRTLEGGT